MRHATPITPQRAAWLRTATPAPATLTLNAAISAQAIVIGGGIAGLNCAIRCAELGRDVVVLEAHDVGFGASGRSGGQLIPGLKHDPATLSAMLGEAIGLRLARFTGDAPSETFKLIERYAIDCDAQQKGWLQPATNEINLKTVIARAKTWSDFTGASMPVLGRDDVRRLTGSDCFVGGWIDPRGGQVQPLSYTRELARVAQSLGVRVHTHAAVTSLQQRGGRWVLQANGHEVSAQHLFVCANGYGGEVGTRYARSFIPASSIMASTEPLPDAVRAQVMPCDLPMSDARRLLNYVRFDPAGRFLIGARGSFGLHEPAAGFARLRATALHWFPALAGVAWEDDWGGLFALTTDFLPHLQQPEPNAWTLVGCNGRGMALMTMAARAMAEAAVTANPDASPVPVAPLQRIPLHAVRRPGLEWVTAWYRLRDRLGV